MSMKILSQLAHFELATPRPQEAARFYTEILGLERSGTEGRSEYFRCWGESYHHSLVITEAAEAAVGHIGWRSDGADGLAEAVDRLQRSGAGEGWVDATVGHGPAYRFRGPGGLVQEVFWEVDRLERVSADPSTFPSRPQRRSGRGCEARQIDHVTAPAGPHPLEAARWYVDTLGFRFTEYTVLDDLDETPVFAMVSTNEQSHDMGVMGDASGRQGRVHHIAYWLEEPAMVYRAADLLLESGVALEFGPGRHGMGENIYLYFRDPNGLRIELFSGGRRNYEPDLEPVKWKVSQGSNDFYRNRDMSDSMLEAFPPTEAVVEVAGANPWSTGGAR